MMVWRWFFLTGLLLATACQANNRLEGSIDETLSLDFDEVIILKQDLFLVVEYLRVTTRGTEKICKLVLDTDGLDLPRDESFELDGDEFLDHVELQRSTFKNDAFPPKQSGYLNFKKLRFRVGGTAEGNFEVTFEERDSLKGWFEGEIEE